MITLCPALKPERPDGQRDGRETDERRAEAVPEAHHQNTPSAQ